MGFSFNNLAPEFTDEYLLFGLRLNTAATNYNIFVDCWRREYYEQGKLDKSGL